MSRSLKKGPFINNKLIKKVSFLKQGDKTPIKTWARSSQISPQMIGYVFAVHTGKTFTNVEVKEEHVGHRLGEFAPTKKFVRHGGKMQKGIETKAKKPPIASPVKK